MGQKPNITKFLASIFAPKAVSDILDNQDPKLLAQDCGKGLRRAITAQIGDKAYKTLKGRLIVWLDLFYTSFRRVLYDD